MSQVVDLLFKLITLGRFKLETSCPQFTDDSFEPMKMFLWSSTEDNNVIQVDNAPIQVQHAKAGFHQPLKGCWGIGEPKGHAFTFPETKWTHGKCSQRLSFLL